MSTRRNFLQKMGLGALALQLASVKTFATDVPVDDIPYEGQTLRVAIMGLGGYGTRVAQSMQNCSRAKLVGVISGTPSKVTKWQADFGIPEKNCYNYDNFDAVKNNPDINAIYVCTPNAQHHGQVIRIAKAGKHAICEKPMAVSAKEAREMIDACDKAKVKLLIGYRMHFEPHTLEVIRMRKAGEFGQIRFFQGLCGFKTGDPKQWRLNKALSGGGSMMDIGIYALNGARYMVGEEPIWVTAQETKTDTVKFKDGIDETIQFQLGFPSGAVASCLSTYNVNNLDRFFLDGDKGFAEMLPSTNYGPINGRTHKGPINQPYTTHQTVQMDEFAAIIFDGKQPVIPVDGHEGLRDMKIIEAIYQACKTGKKVTLLA
ncbi:Gfo/Idh/MocA family protein [Mucilaginibacter myungsuensis]|uniref:Gfo/Idh/MocA family oxidoreductase n=1 Tax=Mucilaginibacter myungsuensis TaxID=649104 RepID=A0A929KU14_9SPHI|nr:Gfo/Idh/MocA family oxidoreductase [Mucilaginibacter myungsuensis]MBE9660782.1 Gfo/Idh/MocA family oxidoreductase [Mucilaginibacter myungsuensis]MDN3600827.1 Gfo/Idh/MocA family oxidoreductase [Mucilaginibacter myungsuensis]